MKKYTFAGLTFLLLSFTIIAQDKQIADFSTVKTEKGMMVINYDRSQSFAFLVAGRNPESKQNEDGSLLIRTENNGVIVYFIKTSTFLDQKKITRRNELLYTHRERDIAAQETALKTKLNVDVQGFAPVKVYNMTDGIQKFKDIPSYYWSYPSSDSENRAYYQTVLMGNQVLMLGTVFDRSVKMGEVRSFFTQTLESLTLLPPQKAKASTKKKTGQVKKN
jgi:hypothetical protein